MPGPYINTTTRQWEATQTRGPDISGPYGAANQK